MQHHLGRYAEDLELLNELEQLKRRGYCLFPSITKENNCRKRPFSAWSSIKLHSVPHLEGE